MNNNAIYFHRPGSVLSTKDSSMNEIWLQYLAGENGEFRILTKDRFSFLPVVSLERKSSSSYIPTQPF